MSPRFVHRCACVVLALVLGAGFLQHAMAMQKFKPVPSPEASVFADLPALMLTPTDLEEEGLAGFGLSNSLSFLSLDFLDAATVYAESRGALMPQRSRDGVRFMRENGWVRNHEGALARTREPGNFTLTYSVNMGIEEYEDDDGARGV